MLAAVWVSAFSCVGRERQRRPWAAAAAGGSRLNGAAADVAWPRSGRSRLAATAAEWQL